MKRSFVGFGFGAIQGGLFLPEVQKSGNFDRLVVAEVDADLVQALRSAKGCFSCNVAEKDGVRIEKIEGVEILNPLVQADRERLVHAVAEASELCTALPSYQLYDLGMASVSRLLAEGFSKKMTQKELPSAVVYAAENDDRAASRLQETCLKYYPSGFANRAVFSETVIGKMCSVVSDENRIQEENLVRWVMGSNRALLVEAFDQVFVEDRIPEGFERGLKQVIAKPDLYPFASAKFLGQNAIHATLGYFAEEAGLTYMSDLRSNPELVSRGMEAFIGEAMPGLLHRFSQVEDALFTEDGFAKHAKATVERMLNPFLADPVARVTRDPVRKLGWDDRLVGSIRLAHDSGVQPRQLGRAAKLALNRACQEKGWGDPRLALDQIWSEVPAEKTAAIRELILG